MLRTTTYQRDWSKSCHFGARRCGGRTGSESSAPVRGSRPPTFYRGTVRHHGEPMCNVVWMFMCNWPSASAGLRLASGLRPPRIISRPTWFPDPHFWPPTCKYLAPALIRREWESNFTWLKCAIYSQPIICAMGSNACTRLMSKAQS